MSRESVLREIERKLEIERQARFERFCDETAAKLRADIQADLEKDKQRQNALGPDFNAKNFPNLYCLTTLIWGAAALSILFFIDTRLLDTRLPTWTFGFALVWTFILVPVYLFIHTSIRLNSARRGGRPEA